MPRAKETWAEKMRAKPPYHVVLEKNFSGSRINFTHGQKTEC